MSLGFDLKDWEEVEAVEMGDYEKLELGGHEVIILDARLHENELTGAKSLKISIDIANSDKQAGFFKRQYDNNTLSEKKWPNGGTKYMSLSKESLKNLHRIQIVACGTSLHAAMVGKYLVEDLCGIPVDVEPASEFIYRRTITNEKTLVIGVSQSGETADTITAVRQAKKLGSHILIVTNRPDSTMAREADSLVPVNAGIEVSVAATKSYMAQVISFYLLAIYFAEVKGVEAEFLNKLKHELIVLPQKIEEVLTHKDAIQTCARKFSSAKDFIFIARGINFATALEGALKLKEISYINATGYTAGELKHGPIAMLDESMPVLSILMKGGVYEKILSNSEEAKARNARMIALTNSDDEKLKDLFECIMQVPEIDEMLSPALAIVPLQLLAYYIAEFLGKDVDQPRNLAKSVTVE